MITLHKDNQTNNYLLTLVTLLSLSFKQTFFICQEQKITRILIINNIQQKQIVIDNIFFGFSSYEFLSRFFFKI